MNLRSVQKMKEKAAGIQSLVHFSVKRCLTCMCCELDHAEGSVVLDV